MLFESKVFSIVQDTMMKPGLKPTKSWSSAHLPFGYCVPEIIMKGFIQFFSFKGCKWQFTWVTFKTLPASLMSEIH